MEENEKADAPNTDEPVAIEPNADAPVAIEPAAGITMADASVDGITMADVTVADKQIADTPKADKPKAKIPKAEIPKANATNAAKTETDQRPDYLAEIERMESEDQLDGQAFLKEQQARHLRWKHEESRRRRKHVLIALGGVCGCFAVIAVICGLIEYFRSPVVKSVAVEAGGTLAAEDFLTDDAAGMDVAYVTDASDYSFDHVGTYEIVLKAKNRKWKSTMEVQDTVAPQGTAVSTSLNVGGTLEAEELVSDISDVTEVTCAYKEEPDYSREGMVYPVVVLTDEGGNSTEITGTVEVLEDKEAPVIDGVVALDAFLDVPVSYKSNIIVTDDCDPDVELTVDTSAVNPDQPGTYDITYTATDWAGHTASASTTITFSEKPDDYVEESVVLEEAQEILDEIVTDDMTRKQKAQAIYNWVRANLYYSESTYKESWTNGAHIGFTTGTGDCYIYFAVTKALLTQAGIPNIDVEKSNTTRSHHYWSLVNVGDGWYHLDTTPRESGATFFLVTDEEMLSYFEQNGTYDAFDTSLYPSTPTTPSTIE
ncbi:MAG: hypothetical protein LUI13_08645 [Lachnospiraceae bacterium]|nr:hypothetical protein [Lachnospiraceae bacterium]